MVEEHKAPAVPLYSGKCVPMRVPTTPTYQTDARPEAKGRRAPAEPYAPVKPVAPAEPIAPVEPYAPLESCA